MKASLLLLMVASGSAYAGSFHIGMGNALASEGAKVVNNAVNASLLPSCGGNFQLFTQSPITDPSFVNLTPLGSQSDHVLPPDHMYLNFTLGSSGQALYAPSSGWVVQVTASYYTTGLATSYSIGFSPCEEVVMNFMGGPSISAGLAAAVATAPETSCAAFNDGGQEIGTSCVSNLRYPVAAGTVLGTGEFGDFGPLEDSRVQLQGFANPARHNLNRGFCPLNYWKAGALPSSQWTTGDYINGATVARSTTPLCGTIVQDVPGTAQGDWYVPSAPETQEASYQYENSELALVHDSVYASTAVFSIGANNGLYSEIAGNEKAYFQPKLASGAFINDGSRIDIDFSFVTSDGNIYCYDTLNTFNPEFSPSYLTGYIILLQLTDANDLKIEAQDPGGAATCASTAGTWAFTSNAVTFER